MEREVVDLPWSISIGVGNPARCAYLRPSSGKVPRVVAYSGRPLVTRSNLGHHVSGNLLTTLLLPKTARWFTTTGRFPSRTKKDHVASSATYVIGIRLSTGRAATAELIAGACAVSLHRCHLEASSSTPNTASNIPTREMSTHTGWGMSPCCSASQDQSRRFIG